MTERLWLRVLTVLLSARLARSACSVTSYSLSLAVPSSVSASSTVPGTVVINFSCLSATDTITLHWGSSIQTAPDNSSISVLRADSTTVETIFVTTDSTSETVVISGTTPFTEGESVQVTVQYEATVNQDTQGIFVRIVPNADNTSSSFVGTAAWPTGARHVLPCVDDPGSPALWTFTLTRPSSWKAACSLRLISSASTELAMTTDVYSSDSATLPPNSFSLFLSEDFSSTAYSRGESASNLTFWAHRASSGTTLSVDIQFLAGYFYLVDDVLSTSFTATDALNVVLVANLPEPVAGLGIIYIRADSYSEDYGSAQKEGLFRSRVVPVLRQFIQQYTRFSTRSVSWVDAGMSDALGMFIEYTILNNLGTAFDFATDVEVEARQTAMALDLSSSSRPLVDSSVNTDSTAAIEASLMDPLKKLKGGVILNMFDMDFPAGSVLSAIKTILKSNVNGQVSSLDVLSVFNSTVYNSGGFLSTGAESALATDQVWFVSRGYPLLQVQGYTEGTPGIVNLNMVKRPSPHTNMTYTETTEVKSTEKTNYTATADKINDDSKLQIKNVSYVHNISTTKKPLFCELSSCASPEPVVEFHLGVTVSSRSDSRYYTPRQDLWLNVSSPLGASLDIVPGDWVVANIRSSGYYRANYSSDNWDLITAALARAQGEIRGRSHVIDDALTLANLGLLSYNVSLRLALANLADPYYRNWYPVYKHLSFINDRLWGQNGYSTFESFATTLLEQVDSLLHNSSVDPYEAARIQALFHGVLCEFDIADYRTRAANNLAALLSGDLADVPTNVASSVYDSMVCCGARYSNSLSGQELWTSVINFSASYYRKHFSSIALGCLFNYTDVSRLFEEMLTSDYENKPYLKTIFHYLAETHPLELIANLSTVAEQLQSRLGAATVVSLLRTLDHKINNETTSLMLAEAMKPTSLDIIVTEAAASITSGVKSKLTWMSERNESLLTALKFATTLASHSTSTGVTQMLLLFPFTVICLVVLK